MTRFNVHFLNAASLILSILFACDYNCHLLVQYMFGYVFWGLLYLSLSFFNCMPAFACTLFFICCMCTKNVVMTQTVLPYLLIKG